LECPSSADKQAAPAQVSQSRRAAAVFSCALSQVTRWFGRSASPGVGSETMAREYTSIRPRHCPPALPLSPQTYIPPPKLSDCTSTRMSTRKTSQ
jgi:hypothetical protein